MKRITIKDVARESGMSLATVSGVLNGANGFAAKTVKHVWDVANRMNYIPSPSARGLRNGTTYTRQKTSIIMHIVHMNNVVPYHCPELESSVFRLAWQAQKRNFFSIPYAYYQLDGFRCPPLLNGYVDGALIGTPHLEVIQAVSGKVPVVLMDVPFSPDLTHVPIVNVDYKRGMLAVMKILKEKGHRSISVCIPYLESNVLTLSKIIMSACSEAALVTEIKINKRFSMVAKMDESTHQQKMREFADILVEGIRKKAITAVVAPDTSYILSLKQHLQDSGVRVPEDISLIAPYIGFSPPAGVSSLFMNRAKIIDTSLDLLSELIRGKKSNPSEILISPEYMEGGTVGNAKEISS